MLMMTKTVYMFPGQGSQFPGMAKNLYEEDAIARKLFEEANDILGFRITDIMFDGTAEDLKATNVTQPAIFLHSVVLSMCRPELKERRPDMAAGHSLGEFSALAAVGAIAFSDALKLVAVRAREMQKCCEAHPGAMAAIIKMDSAEIERICAETPGIVVPANYNCDGQVVISGESEAVAAACERLKAAGAKRALMLPVGGAFHSPLMEPARIELGKAIEKTPVREPVCPVWQNVTAEPTIDPAKIKENLLLQLTSPVRWTQTIQGMLAGGATEFVEIGPGSVLQGLVARMAPAGGIDTAGGIDIKGYE